MDPETLDGTEVLETPVEPEGETVETPEEPEFTAEQLAELKAKAAKADELEEKNKKLYERAKKAEAKVPSNEQFSTKDVLALTEAKVSSEDYDEVVRIAKILDKPIVEALKDKTMKTILDTRAEERRSAAAAHTQGGARGSAKVSGEDLLSQAQRTGEVPTSDEGMADLYLARQARRLQKTK